MGAITTADAADAHDHHDDHAGPKHLPGDAPGPHQWKVAGWQEAPPMCLAALVFTAFGCVALFFYAETIYRFLLPVIQGGAS